MSVGFLNLSIPDSAAQDVLYVKTTEKQVDGDWVYGVEVRMRNGESIEVACESIGHANNLVTQVSKTINNIDMKLNADVWISIQDTIVRVDDIDWIGIGQVDRVTNHCAVVAMKNGKSHMFMKYRKVDEIRKFIESIRSEMASVRRVLSVREPDEREKE